MTSSRRDRLRSSRPASGSPERRSERGGEHAREDARRARLPKQRDRRSAPVAEPRARASPRPRGSTSQVGPQALGDHRGHAAHPSVGWSTHPHWPGGRVAADGKLPSPVAELDEATRGVGYSARRLPCRSETTWPRVTRSGACGPAQLPTKWSRPESTAVCRASSARSSTCRHVLCGLGAAGLLSHRLKRLVRPPPAPWHHADSLD